MLPILEKTNKHFKVFLDIHL